MINREKLRNPILWFMLLFLMAAPVMSVWAQTVMVPSDALDKEIHVILEVKDNGSPNLTSYRRVIIYVKK